MRKHRHLPQFTKRHYFAEDNPVRHIGRRAHGLLSGVRYDRFAHESAAKRANLYRHASQKRRGQWENQP